MNNTKLILFTTFFVIIILLILAYIVYTMFVPESVKSVVSPTVISSLNDIAKNPQSVIPDSLQPLLKLTSDQMNNLVSIAKR